MKFSELIVALLIAPILPVANAASLSSIGPTYPIGEGSTFNIIMKKSRERERSGELGRLQEKTIHRSIGSIKNMKSVDGITIVCARMQRSINPIVIYAKPVTTDDGRIVMPARAEINPLDITNLMKTLVFFDSRDPEQCEVMGCSVVKGGQLKVKSTLAAGSWLDLTKAWKTQVFYDQEGTLLKRFGITIVPAVIRQQGKMLMLDEAPAKKLQRNADL